MGKALLPEGMKSFSRDVGHSGIVQRFLSTRGMYVQWGAVKDEKFHTHAATEARDTVKFVGELLRRAHIIEVPARLYESAYAALLLARDDLVVQLHPKSVEDRARGGVMPTLPAAVVKEAAKRTYDDIFVWNELSKEMPFSTLYLGYDEFTSAGFSMDLNGVECWTQPPGPTSFGTARFGDGELYGHLITSEGDIVSLVSFEDLDNEMSVPAGVVEGSRQQYAHRMAPVVERYKGHELKPSRQYPLTGTNTIVPHIVQWLNDHKTVLETKHGKQAHRRIVQSFRKKNTIRGRVMPPPYYTVVMRDQVIQEVTRKVKKEADFRILQAYQYDVRAHDRIRVRRGPLPLGEDTRAWLEKPRVASKKKYHIFETMEPTGSLASALWKRGVRRKRPDEWMAVLVTRVADHTRGPDDAPYIPSTRRSENHDKVAK
jgi:hypothetical protein